MKSESSSHDSELSITGLSAQEALAVVVGELTRQHSTIERLVVEVARLHDAVRRPERVLLYKQDLAQRLSKSTRSILRLWDDGKLDFKREGRRRYSTLAQLEAYLRDANFAQ